MKKDKLKAISTVMEMIIKEKRENRGLKKKWLV